MFLRRWKIFAIGAGLAVALTACGGTQDENVGVFKGVPDVPVAGGASGGASNDLAVDSGSGADLKFAETSLSAATGTIKVTFNNKATPGLQHNWVLVKPGDEDKVVAEAASATDFLPKTGFVAHTKTIDGGKSDAIEFDVAEAGDYTYVCTFPGHYAAGMKGTLKVAAGGGGGAPAGGGAQLTADSGAAADLKFAEATLEAPAGDVTVTFNNKATPGLQHNWVLVKPGDEDKVVAEAAANTPDFLPKTGFVAHTKTIDGGKSDTASFKAEPGTYTYLCTFPGHYAAGMKGTLTVK